MDLYFLLELEQFSTFYSLSVEMEIFNLSRQIPKFPNLLGALFEQGYLNSYVLSCGISDSGKCHESLKT